MHRRFATFSTVLGALVLAAAMPLRAAVPAHRIVVNTGSVDAAGTLIARTPPLPDTLRVLAIRVDFQPDTLSTTTGDGSFFYEIPAGEDPENWRIDPPPHDSLYFADQLFALRRYYERFSRGKLTLTGRLNSGGDSGGDLFPAGAQDAYTLPYPIWHINYGDGDERRLNETLTQLFIDAWTLADEDPDVNLSRYDLYLIFHAGAGNEFDTGFDTTPFDIPSVVISPNDLTDYGGLPGELTLTSGTLRWGAILPETQRQGDVEVGLLGTIVHQAGYLLGMPHLYDTETGNPAIGMFGVMDRGFGGFFGLIPTPPSAWTRAYMGWDSVTTISSGDVELGALNLPDERFTGGLDRLVKVPINEHEYYLLESRLRDPEGDSLTYGYDRDSLRITFHDNYTVDVDPGFRVLVDVDDPDFDLPASGVLVWHIDQSVIDQKLDSDRLQTNRDWRAVDLEEMDGSEDIGNTYEFLTPSYGTEYGIREDAFYAGNELWQEANGPYPVEFSPATIPSTRANNGGESHITLRNVSAIDDTMTLTVVNTWEQGAFPHTLDWADGNVDLTFADLDGDDSLELVLWDEGCEIAAYRADGSPFAADTFLVKLPAGNYTLLTGSTPGMVYAVGENADYALHEDGGGFVAYLLASYASGSPPLGAALIGKPGQETLVTLRSSATGYLLRQDYQGMLPAIFSSVHVDTLDEVGSLVRLGPVGSDTLLVVLSSGKLLGVLKSQAAPGPAETLSSAPGLRAGETVGNPLSADFDGDGLQDAAALTSRGRFIVWYASDGSGWNEAQLQTPEDLPSSLYPADVDRDGFPELAGVVQRSLLGLEANGLVSEGTPVTLSTGNGLPMPANALFADVNGQDVVNLLVPSVIEPGRVAIAGYELSDGRSLPGFPLDFGYLSGQHPPRTGIADLDGDGDLELVTVTRGPGVPELRVYDLPARGGGTAKVFWGLADGDAAKGRAYPFTSQATGSGSTRTLADAYIWPNPVRQRTAHLRFFGVSGGRASLRVYDLVGRLVTEKSSPVTSGTDNEITFTVGDWPSGVYVARLQAGGSHTLIRFAVVR